MKNKTLIWTYKRFGYDYSDTDASLIALKWVAVVIDIRMDRLFIICRKDSLLKHQERLYLYMNFK